MLQFFYLIDKNKKSSAHKVYNGFQVKCKVVIFIFALESLFNSLQQQKNRKMVRIRKRLLLIFGLFDMSIGKIQSVLYRFEKL